MAITRLLSACLVLAGVALWGAQARAQPYPSKPIRLVVGFPPGSTVDVSARLLARKMGEALDQPLVTDNRVGAGGIIGAAAVAKAPADGYTLLFTTPSTHVIAVFLSKELPYDPVRDFTPIASAIDTYHSRAVGPAGPLNSLRELVEYAKRNPGKLTYSSAGLGTVFHLTGELFKRAAGVDILHVPYKSAVQALPDLAAGRISMTFSTLQSQLPLSRSGKIRIVGMLTADRYPGLPEVPAVAEVVPGFERPADWIGFFGPAGLPRAIVERLGAEVKAALAAPEIVRTLDENAQRAIWTSPEDFARMIRQGTQSTGRAVKAAGIQPER
ncbi:MAG: tripartite tricarboxylate transporter substrate binding protein [Burkholderiales bacterium]|nr:tripartite tricarboxylate transporter substrate binding protein [Burkholderiales bacterium]